MKKVLILVVAFASFVSADYVNGYYKQDGTYIEGHYRSTPNSTVYDNYSTYGNTNPYTGKKGKKKYSQW